MISCALIPIQDCLKATDCPSVNDHMRPFKATIDHLTITRNTLHHSSSRTNTHTLLHLISFTSTEQTNHTLTYYCILLFSADALTELQSVFFIFENSHFAFKSTERFYRFVNSFECQIGTFGSWRQSRQQRKDLKRATEPDSVFNVTVHEIDKYAGCSV